MNWQRLVGWQLLLFAGMWTAVVLWSGDATAAALAAVPGVADTVSSEPFLGRVLHAWAFAPGLLAAALGLVFVLASRKAHRTLAEQLAAEGDGWFHR